MAASANNHASTEKADPCNHLSRDTRIAGRDLRNQSKAACSQRPGGKGAAKLPPRAPICRHLPGSWKIYDEIYQFKNFDRTKVHGLLTLDKHPNDKTPGDYPVSWCKEYGQGRVFYTSLGHREDIWTPNTPANFKRMNSKEIAEAYQKHILMGIKWALGLEKMDAKPQKRAVE